MRRGDVWWAQLPLPIGRCPVVLVSRDAAYAVRESVTVAAISTTVRGIRSEVALGKRDRLPRACAIQTDNLYTIEKRLLEEKLTSLTRSRIQQLDDALRYALGLDGDQPPPYV